MRAIADGSLIFDTKINTGGFDSGVSSLKSKGAEAVKSIGLAFGAVAGKIAVGSLREVGSSIFNGIEKMANTTVDLTKSAVNYYADYQQQVGGVETLFKDSADMVKGYADNAYMTAGLSANEYMRTVTSFSASLLQSLDGDTEAAAKVAQRAITDMSDNANKMGTGMASIQYAYMGFAKQNYTMLDNLKLGYGGTKGEMERLIEDANKLKEANGEAADLSIESFADIVEAIGLIQDELGITGTTAKEAATTIEGSFNMVKASFTNLLTGMANQELSAAQVDELFGQLETSLYTAFDNVMPAIETAVPRITQGLTKAVKMGIEGLANDPEAFGKAADALGGLLDGAIEILDVGNANFEKIADGIFGGLKETVTPERVSGLVSGLFTGASGLLDSFVKHGPEVAAAFFEGIAAGLSNGETAGLAQSVIDTIMDVLNIVVDNMDVFVDVITTIASELLTTLILNLPKILVGVAKGLATAPLAAFQAVAETIFKIFGVDPDENIGPVETAAEELARKQSEAYFYAVESQLQQHGLDWSYQDYLDNKGWTLFDDSGVFIDAAQEQGESDGEAAAGAYKEGYMSGVQKLFDNEEEYNTAMARMGYTEFPPFDEKQRQQAQEEGKKYGGELGRAYLDGIDMGVEEAMIAQQIAAGNGVIDYTLPQVRAVLEETDGPGGQSGGETQAKEVSQQLVEDIQSELAGALSQLKETGGLTNVGTMMLEAIVAGMQDAKNLEALAGAVTGIKQALTGAGGEGEEGSSIADEFRSAGEEIGKALIEGLSSGMGSSGEDGGGGVDKALDGILKAAEGQASAFSSAGQSLGEAFSAGVAAGISSGSGGIYDAVYDVMRQAVADGKASIDSHSPSKLTRDMIGLPFAQGIGVGITKGMSAVRKAARDESVLAAVEAARAANDAFRADPFGGTRSLGGTPGGAPGGGSTTYSNSYTFNSPKALDFREMRRELRRVDQYQRTMVQ